MTTYYIIKIEVLYHYDLTETSAIFDESVDAVEEEARSRARSILRPRGSEVTWSYYGPFEMDDSLDAACNFGVI